MDYYEDDIDENLAIDEDPDEVDDIVDDGPGDGNYSGGEDDDDEVEDIDEEAEDTVETDEVEEVEDLEEESDAPQTTKYSEELIVVKPENRRTPSILNLYEMTELISIRASQIAKYSNCMVDITGLDDPIKMAKRELMMRTTPLILERIVGELKNPKTGEIDRYVEYWNPNEMQFKKEYDDVL